MKRGNLLLTAAIVAGLFSPAAAAAWSSHTETEPNTVFDTSAYMYQDPEASGDGSVRQVYLNAFPSSSLGVFWANGNTATLGSRVSPTPTNNYAAVFGVWKDCNDDGYIGNAESALQVYRAETLLVEGICPVGADDHNDGEWVYELISIGVNDPCVYEPQEIRADPNHECFGAGEFLPRPGVLYVNGTNLWGDQGHPGEALGGSSCPIRPLPRGSFSNTGRMIVFADCFVGFRVANTLTNELGVLGLGFDNPRAPHEDEDHPLVMDLPVSTFGNPNGDGRTGLLEQDTGKPTVATWDCSGAEPAPAGAPASDPTSSSLIDTADNAVDGATVGQDEVQSAVETYNTQVLPVVNDVLVGNGISEEEDPLRVERNDCDPETRNEFSSAYYDQNLYGQDPSFAGLLEGNNNPSDTGNGKFENDFTMTFFDAVSDPRNAENRPAYDLFGERTTDGDFGLGLIYGAGWNGDVNYVSTPQLINRATLAPSSRSYWTIYAQIDREAFSALGLSIPSPADFVYAEEACGSATTGTVNNWNCDADAWFPDGQAQYMDGTTRGARPGDLYQMRDVDCFDGTIVGGLPARASLTDVSPAGICDSSTPLL